MQAEDLILLIEQGKKDKVVSEANALELIAKRFREIESESISLMIKNIDLKKANDALCLFPPEYKSYQEFMDHLLSQCIQAEKDWALLHEDNKALKERVKELEEKSIFKTIKEKIKK